MESDADFVRTYLEAIKAKDSIGKEGPERNNILQEVLFSTASYYLQQESIDFTLIKEVFVNILDKGYVFPAELILLDYQISTRTSSRVNSAMFFLISHFRCLKCEECAVMIDEFEKDAKSQWGIIAPKNIAFKRWKRMKITSM